MSGKKSTKRSAESRPKKEQRELIDADLELRLTDLEIDQILFAARTGWETEDFDDSDEVFVIGWADQLRVQSDNLQGVLSEAGGDSTRVTSME